VAFLLGKQAEDIPFTLAVQKAEAKAEVVNYLSYQSTTPPKPNGEPARTVSLPTSCTCIPVEKL
jgi:hypothetical protein